MLRLMLACGLVAFAAFSHSTAAAQAKTPANTKAQAQADTKANTEADGWSPHMADWQPFDLSILFPLNSQVDVKDSGLCNLPRLGSLTKSGKPLLPKPFFHRIVDEAFGLESPVTAPYYSQQEAKGSTAQTWGQLAPKDQIKRQQFAEQANVEVAQKRRKEQLAAVRSAFASEKYPMPLLCGRAPQMGGLAKLSDEVILDAGGHLAQLRRYPADICEYDNWRVTAVRFDLCLEQPEIKDFDSKTAMLPAECLTQEFRVTLKPVYSSAQRVKMDNFAIKLVYYLGPDADKELVKALKRLRTLTRVATKPEVNDGMLKPHPGLVQEMTSCKGSIANGVHNLLHHHGLVENLVYAQYIGSNRDLDRMSMGVVPFYQARQDSMAGLDQVNSFSVRNLDPSIDARPYSANLLPSHNQVVQGFAKPFRNSRGQLKDPTALSVARDIVAKANKIANPRLISQFPLHAGVYGTDCLSCHLAEAAEVSVKNSAADIQQVASQAFRYYSKEGRLLKPWPQLERKTVRQLDNFGYFYNPRNSSISYKISQRAINETDNQYQLIRTYYESAPAAN